MAWQPRTWQMMPRHVLGWLLEARVFISCRRSGGGPHYPPAVNGEVEVACAELCCTSSRNPGRNTNAPNTFMASFFDARFPYSCQQLDSPGDSPRSQESHRNSDEILPSARFASPARQNAYPQSLR